MNQQVKKRLAEEEDLFLDDEVAPTATASEAPVAQQPATGKPKTKKAKKRINTALLDAGVNFDDDEEEQNLLKDTPPTDTYTTMPVVPPPPQPVATHRPQQCEFCAKFFANAPAVKRHQLTASKRKAAHAEQRHRKIEATIAEVEGR